VLEVHTDEGWFVVEYNGRGFGYESVWVNGRCAARETSALWFVPRFVFRLGFLPAAVEVRVWPWLTIRSFHLVVGDAVLYSEGSGTPRVFSRGQDEATDPHTEQVREADWHPPRPRPRGVADEGIQE
jgi:hypothetical protein